MKLSFVGNDTCEAADAESGADRYGGFRRLDVHKLQLVVGNHQSDLDGGVCTETACGLNGQGS